MPRWIIAACLLSAVVHTPASAQVTLGEPGVPEVKAGDSNQIPGDASISRRPDPQDVYGGWRLSQLRGQTVFDSSGARQLATIDDLILLPDGRITAVVVTGNDKKETLYRIPWRDIRFRPGGAGMQLRTEYPESQWTLLSLGTTGILREFRLAHFLSDSVNLQTGLRYGFVEDVTFSLGGEARTVLVRRDQSSGRGTYAFLLPPFEAAWAPSLSYYNLPFSTEREADAAGLRVQPERFEAPQK